MMKTTLLIFSVTISSCLVSCTPLIPQVDVEEAERGPGVADLPQVELRSQQPNYRYNRGYGDDYHRR